MIARVRARLGWAVLAVHLAFAGSAMAESAPAKLPAVSVMVVDVQAALQQSLAAKGIRAQRDQYLQTFQGELDGNRASLKEMEADLVKQKSTMAPEAWQQKARSFEQQVFEFNQRFQRNNQAVEKSFRTAMGALSDALAQVTEELAGEMGANLVLPKSQIFLHDPRMEMTQQVVERLNKKYPSVPFPAPTIEGATPPKSPPSAKKK
ncbi:MAG: OmpH family outer membrane protein [Magnetospirillum sp.]|nr:OmpH family outer membrane protein [Magnetospirillum sp.]